MEAPTGGGRDSRFNMGYNMSLLGSESGPEMYGRPSTSIPSGVSRSPLGSACGAGGLQRGMKRPSADVCFEQERAGMSGQGGMGLPGDCASDIADDGFSQAQKKTPPPNGKKTKGRVKIKMEYIDNKLRRYTTFSKRKTGIMKKAYELSTLTGTQVMLLVASETGHVYTFATRKLQPMITSEAGKALIQTCLNSPDPPTPGSGGDQRMSATGFEETELTYNIGDEEQKEEPQSPRSEPGGLDSADSSGGDSPPPPPQQPPPQQQQPPPCTGADLGAAPDHRGPERKSPPQAAHCPAQPQPQPLIAGMVAPPYPGLLYQAAAAGQGPLVYAAAPASALPNGVIFSLSQGQLQQLQQEAAAAAAGVARASSQSATQQFITIPLPVALAPPPNGHAAPPPPAQEAADLSNKTRK